MGTWGRATHTAPLLGRGPKGRPPPPPPERTRPPLLLLGVQAPLERPDKGSRYVERVRSGVYFTLFTHLQDRVRMHVRAQAILFQFLFNTSDYSRSMSHFAARSPLTPLYPCLSCLVLSLTKQSAGLQLRIPSR